MIKKQLKTVIIAITLFCALQVNAQNTINFDEFSLDSTGYWVADSLNQHFTINNITFKSNYDTNWGGFWSGGFGYSNHTDTTTAGFTNIYSSYAGNAYSNDQFAIVNAGVFNDAKIVFDSAQIVQGFYISNNTYAALSMKYGDSFGKVVGADTLANGSDTNHLGEPITGEDWFKITVTPYHGDSLYQNEAVEYYLADYRFADDTQDYIVKEWRWVDLSSIPASDSLLFMISSSDVGQYGMNTPAYFCMDDFTVGEKENNINQFIDNLISVYPNPTNGLINIKIPSNDFKISIINYLGNQVKTSTQSTIDISELEKGVYILQVFINNMVVNKRIIKN